MSTYLLKNLSPVFWDAVKRRAKSEGRTIRWVILTLLARYVERGLED